MLAPGGRFAFTGWSDRTVNGSQDAPTAVPSPFTERLDALFAEFSEYLPPGGSMGQPVDAAELLEAAGFADLRVDHAAVAVPFDDNEHLWRWIMTHGYRAFVEDLPADRGREFHRRVLELPSGDRVLRRRAGI